ncbi:hypothetical protein WOSG25_021890 [Weissella oryzae SG25]|uniref:Uncharacterized protein n=1 Tax=Weissella oryzae (strain DSM 25784 / JCM 18191 / LMG 30913 / SG25) TaxID=1329250 RepID=A0A069CSM0_WEIOS|nr:hypothetical protein WOSG25_021890 [Weissella oryzae SG25]
MTKYFAFDVVGNPSRLIGECPGCQYNLDGKTDFCPECDTYVVNRCTGHTLVELITDTESNLVTSDPFEDFKNHKINIHVLDSDIKYSGCGSYCSGSARYCPKCGNITTFTFQSMFDDSINKETGTSNSNPYFPDIVKSRLK